MHFCSLATSHESKQSLDGVVLGHRRKCFVIILPPSLGESLSTETSFVATIVLDSENPTSFDYFGIGEPRYQSSDIVPHDRFILGKDSLLPLLRIVPIHSFMVVGRPD